MEDEDLLALQQQLVQPHARRVGDPGDDLGDLLGLLLGAVPQDVLEDLQVLRLDAVGAVQPGERLGHADRLELPAVARAGRPPCAARAGPAPAPASPRRSRAAPSPCSWASSTSAGVIVVLSFGAWSPPQSSRCRPRRGQRSGARTSASRSGRTAPPAPCRSPGYGHSLLAADRQPQRHLDGGAVADLVGAAR